MIYKYYLSPTNYSNKLESNNEIEYCYYIVSSELTEEEINKLEQIISRNGKYTLYKNTKFKNPKEIGPHTNFKTAWCQNMLDILVSCGLTNISRIEFSTLYSNFNSAPSYDKMLLKHYFQSYFEKSVVNNSELSEPGIEYVDVIEYNKKMSLNMSKEDLITYQNLFQKLGRQPTNVEIYDIAQSQSEHARHWFFKGKINNQEKSLFAKIKSCYQPDIHKTSLISFYDNASVVNGGLTNHIYINSNHTYQEKVKKINFSYKAETHNFPTGISPFPGAATGSGGRIRDILCVGKGGNILAGTAGYCVGDIDNDIQSDDFRKEYGWLPSHPRRILIEASNGASDYGNKIGEPLIQGFTRSFRVDGNQINNNVSEARRIEWLKPIMFSGGIGTIYESDIKKGEPEDNNIIVRVGGPAYRIGMGGGSASSRTQSQENKSDDFQAVQRGDPLMANKLVKFLRAILNRDINPIISIHDQGSGGMANVTREICEEKGATIYLDRVLSGDNSLTALEKWVAEYQEQITMLVNEKDFSIMEQVGIRENISVIAVGKVNPSGHMKVYAEEGNEYDIAVDLPMVLPEDRKKYSLKPGNTKFTVERPLKLEIDLICKINKVFSLVDVGSKQFLTNKVDRSVGGLVVQQQCVGPYHLPLSNLSAVKNSFDSNVVLVSAIGERPYFGVEQDIQDMVSLTVGEMLTNIIWCQIDSLNNINSVANWMWPSTQGDDGYQLLRAVDHLTNLSHKIGFSINGGKDSLSMTVKNNKDVIKAPGTLTLSGYSSIYNYHSIITPNLKGSHNVILLVRLDKFRAGMVGSAYSRFFPINEIPTQWNSPDRFIIIWGLIQELIKSKKIISGHDISDGGLITCLVEMAISSYYGLDLNIKSNFELDQYLFSEELGLVLEVPVNYYVEIIEKFEENQIEVEMLGYTQEERNVFISYNGHVVLQENNDDLRFKWQETSYKLEKEQTNPVCIEEEIKNCYHLGKVQDKLPQDIINQLKYNDLMQFKLQNEKPKVAIMRCDGSNGEIEMAYAFHQVGFECVDVGITDLQNGRVNLVDFRGVVWVGGFTFSDVLGAAEGWCQILTQNTNIKEQLYDFYNREDTFSLGVCNGCQLMSKLGWIENISLEKNISGRFESRWSRVKIEDDNNIFFTGMKGLTLGIYTAHGEGRICCSDENNSNNCYPVKYVDTDNMITEKYPMNPNGSKGGRAAIMSSNGRHMAIMPHPERTVLGWQVPRKYNYNFTPWFLMFKNIYRWCMPEEEDSSDNSSDNC